MQKKIDKIIFDFEVIAFESVPLKTPFTEREFLSSGVNMLTNNVKIEDTTKTEFFELIFFQSDQKIWEKYCHSVLNSVSGSLTCWLSISVLTRSFLRV